jgi:hypothetical protein
MGFEAKPAYLMFDLVDNWSDLIVEQNAARAPLVPMIG